ncbi:hypothetical protein WAZ07_22625 [Bacillus sp. FJAT-51639]|uniref:Uncharacterized protein n=1 Tax=Bacillus bruguierae TaxID=3127667 RepID=A0ABU8FMP5_9BACI
MDKVDEMVQAAQLWVNHTYGGKDGFILAPDHGRTVRQVQLVL